MCGGTHELDKETGKYKEKPLWFFYTNITV